MAALDHAKALADALRPIIRGGYLIVDRSSGGEWHLRGQAALEAYDAEQAIEAEADAEAASQARCADHD